MHSLRTERVFRRLGHIASERYERAFFVVVFFPFLSCECVRFLCVLLSVMWPHAGSGLRFAGVKKRVVMPGDVAIEVVTIYYSAGVLRCCILCNIGFMSTFGLCVCDLCIQNKT